MVRGIKVEKGKDCADPRLQNIDVSKHCLMVTIKVLRPDKRPLANCTVWQVRTEKGSMRSASGHGTDQNGEAHLAVPLEGGKVVLDPRNGRFCIEHFDNLKEDKTVVMRPGLTAVFKLKNLPKLPDNLRLWMSISRQGGGTGWWSNLGSSRTREFLDEDGSLVLYATEPGTYRVQLSPTFSSSGSDRAQRLVQRGRRNGLQFDVEFAKKPAEQKPMEIELDEGELELIKELIEEAAEHAKEQRKGHDRD